MTNIQLTFSFRHGQSAEWRYNMRTGDVQQVRQNDTQNTVAVHSKCNCICSQCRAALWTVLLIDHIVYCHYRPRQCRHVSTPCVFIHICPASSRSTAALQIHFASCILVIFPIAIPCQPFLYHSHCTYILHRQSSATFGLAEFRTAK